MTRYAVILTHNRWDDLKGTVAQIMPQCDRVIIVDNASNPPVSRDPSWQPHVEIVYDPEQPPNLARLWNTQLARIGWWEEGAAAWEVAFLCDDVDVPLGWYSAVVDAMRLHGCAAGSTHQYTPVASPIVKREPDTDIHNRMTGWAFVLAGEKGLVADERFHFWWQDTDLDWAARRNSGMVIAPGPVAKNQQPGYWTNAKPSLTEQAGRDGEAFAAKHGTRPW
jgi:hypothetical protein